MKWNDIKIKHYAQIMKLNEDSFEDQLKAIGIVSGKTLEEVRKLPLTELNGLIESFKELNLSKIPSEPVKKWEKYKITCNIKDITAGQMIDYDSIRSLEDDIQNLHKLMAVLTNPKDEEELNERAEYFWENMPIGVAYGTHVFFCELHKRFEGSIKAFSKGKGNQIRLRSIGGGWPFFMYYRTATQSLKKKWWK